MKIDDVREIIKDKIEYLKGWIERLQKRIGEDKDYIERMKIELAETESTLENLKKLS